MSSGSMPRKTSHAARSALDGACKMRGNAFNGRPSASIADFKSVHNDLMAATVLGLLNAEADAVLREAE